MWKTINMAKWFILLDVIKMGKLNVIISDGLDEKFRLEIAKRLGMKKGNLTKAVEEAMEMWINSDIMGKLKEKAMKEGTTIMEREAIVSTLKSIGKPALGHLGDLLLIEGLTISEMMTINDVIRQIQS